MRVSIIIVNWNTRDMLAQCLAAVYAHPPGEPFEVIVVDNASTDGSPQMVRDCFPAVRLIQSRANEGFARANNQAIAVSAAEYVLLLNSDTEVQPGSLTALVQCMAAHPEAGIVGGKLLNPDGSFQASGNDFPTLVSELASLTGLSRRVYQPQFPSYPPEASEVTRPCGWVGGACLLARRAAMAAVGLLDEGYFMYVEEQDWCYRMQQRGWTVLYCAEAPIIHYGGGSAARVSLGQLQRLYASKARFLERYHGAWTARVFRASVRGVALAQAGRWWLASQLGRADSRARVDVYLRLAQVNL